MRPVDDRSTSRFVPTLVAAGIVFLGAAGMSRMNGAAGDVTPTYELPTQRVLGIGGLLAKVDTRTGAISRFRGELSATASGQSWARRVPPVTGSHSGMLDVVQTRGDSADGTILVDVAGDRTWLLRWRGNEDGIWQELPPR